MASATWAATISVDERLCLALYRASRAMTSSYRPILAPLNLTYPQYLVMSVLWQDGPAGVGSIGERLGLDSSTLSPLLKRLEADGLVARRRSTDDERGVLISLTARGSRLKAKARDVPEDICRATGLTRREHLALTDTLQALVARME